MAEVNWQIEDPVVEELRFSKDAAGFWNVSVALQEAATGSVGKKVVKARLVDEGHLRGKDIAQSMWPVAGSRQEGKPARTTLTFNTGSATYPAKMKLEMELVEK